MSKKDDKRILALLDLIADQQQRINELERRLDEMDAVWPDIVEVVNGAD